MSFDYSKLNGRIVEICKTRGNFAREMGLSERSVSLKLNCKVPFKQEEIVRAMQVLQLPESSITDFFFCHKSSKL